MFRLNLKKPHNKTIICTMSTKPFTKEDDEEISLHSFDSTRSGESVEYERNHHGYTTPQCKSPVHILPPVKEPKRAKRVVQKKKKRIEPICLQQTFPDIRRAVGFCFSCNIMCQTKVFDEYYVCSTCTQNAVGVPLAHPKIKLIIQLRREQAMLRMRLESYENEPCTRESVDLRSRVNAMDRVLAGLIYDRIDLLKL